MKTQTRLLIVASCAGLMVAAGCSKEETPAPPAPRTETPAPADAQGLVAPAAEAVKQKAQEVAAGAQAQVDAATAKAQGLIDQAKKLLAGNQWSEALKLLGELGGMKLTPDQQSLVQTLKDQAEKAAAAAAKAKAADEASKAVGGLLAPKK